MLDKYPKRVQALTTVIETSPYEGFCRFNGLTAEVSSGTFAHEMGHASAKILGIEEELGQMVWDTPGSEITTNDNIFCYGAQCRQRGEQGQAIREYAADAIQAYTEDWQELPDHIRDYIDSKW